MGSGAEIEGLVTRREVRLADIPEIKLGCRSAGRVRTAGIASIEGDRDRRRRGHKDRE